VVLNATRGFEAYEVYGGARSVRFDKLAGTLSWYDHSPPRERCGSQNHGPAYNTGETLRARTKGGDGAVHARDVMSSAQVQVQWIGRRSKHS
jgi:hypothetical protein